mmetsp:Transcript_23133/g.51323  ORF Transcript_23133/g.51323 Transcript_23133/m.51323 type:complete len:600 (+) Transcript_23133:152-1951(+)
MPERTRMRSCPPPTSAILSVLLLLGAPTLLTNALSASIRSSRSSQASVFGVKMNPTSVEEVPTVVSNVASKAEEWKERPLEYKIDLLHQILTNTIEHENYWISLAQQSRGIDPDNARHGCATADVIISSTATFGAYLNGLISTLEYCSKHNGMPPPPRKVRVLPGTGRSIVTLWPSTLLDHLEAVGLRAELVLGDESAEQMNLEREACVGGVAGVLGAGNIDAPIELLCELFLKSRVCIYKPNPVNSKKHLAVAKIFEPLVSAGYLDFVLGGADVGSALVRDSNLDEVVLTGSVNTYEKIKPLTSTPICAELGGVNCWIIAPGDSWSKRSVDGHARHLAFARVANNGHVCAAPQVVMVDREWKWRHQFMDRLRFWLAEYAGAPPFYPGSADTHSRFQDLPRAEVIPGENAFDKQQRPIIFADTPVGDEESTSSIFTDEAFCPVLAEVPVDGGGDPISFLYNAAEIAEKKCFGSLTCNILIPDKIVRKNAREFDEIIAGLPFGVIGVNIFPAFAHSMPQLVWGAAPGHPQSGIGFIGNSGLYRQPQKAVLRAPFNWLGRKALSVMPPKKTEKVFRRLAQYKMKPSLISQTALFTALFLGL